MSVGFGRLSKDNLRFGGTVSADTGLVVNLTDNGRNAGLEIGKALPTATDPLGGLYLVVSTLAQALMSRLALLTTLGIGAYALTRRKAGYGLTR